MPMQDFINAHNISGYYKAKMQNETKYLGEFLFPRRKQIGLDISWIKGAGGLPVVLKPSKFDTAVTVRDRVSFTKIDKEMPYFKEAMLIKEVDRQEILRASSVNNPYLDLAVSKVFDDATTLIKGAVAQEERLKMQLLTTGAIAVSANNTDLSYDYSFKTEHKGKVGAKWSEATASHPVQDILKAQDLVAGNTGARPTKLLLNSTTFAKMLASNSIKLDMNTISGSNIIVTNVMGKEYFKSKLGIDVIVYDMMFVDEAGAKKKFIPDNTAVLLPEGTLGQSHFGTTPEEADLMSGESANVSIVNTGMAITTVVKTDPVNVETKVSMINLPSFEKMDEIFILDTETV